MGKSSSTAAPAPDPAIGQAAASNVELGKEWLQFSKDQYAAGNIRQDEYDKLVKQVTDASLSSQDKANLWAQQDRDTAATAQAKYDQWATQDRATGQAAQTKFNGIADQSKADADKYAQWIGSVAKDYGTKANDQYEFAKTQQGRYSSTFQPIEDKFANDAMTWDSSARLESEAGKARADVASSAAAADQAQQRQMASMGVNPNSGRFAGTTRATGLNTALAEAGAQNVTRDAVRQQAIGYRQAAIGVGQNVLGNANTATALGDQERSAQLAATQAGYQTVASGTGAQSSAITGGLAATGVGATSASLAAGQSGAGYQGLGVGLSAGSAATGAGAAGNANFYQNNNTMAQGFNGAIGANTSAGGMLNSQYGSQINAYGAQQQAAGQASAGTGQAVGAIAAGALVVF